MVRPDLESFRQLASRARAVPLVREVVADLDTALAIFLKVDDRRHAFLFESNEGGEHWGRYSFIGLGARARLRGARRRGRDHAAATRASDTRWRRTAARIRSTSCAGCSRSCAPRRCPTCRASRAARSATCPTTGCATSSGCPSTNPDPLGVPDCWFVFPETVLVHDRAARAAHDHPRRRARATARRVEAAYERGLRAARPRSRRCSRAPAPRPREPRSRSARSARAGLERDARALRRDGEALQGVHPRGRHLPGRALAALHAAAARRSAGDLPRAAAPEPVAVPVLHALRRRTWCWAPRPRSTCGSPTA